MKAFNRVNPHGIHYGIQEHVNGKVLIYMKDEDKSIEVNIPISDVILAWRIWMAGTMIQDAFYFFTPDEREFIKTGITPEEWDVIFKDAKEN
jgi:hypothetical protein